MFSFRSFSCSEPENELLGSSQKKTENNFGTATFSRRFQDFFAIFSFLALVLLFFSRFLDGSYVLAFKDLSRYFYPLRFLMVEQVKAGILPLWNPYIFCGFPLMASLQVGFFYPLTLIYYLLPYNLAFNYYIILHYFLAACFMYALLRHYNLRWAACFFGGLVFAFSGYLLSVSNMNTSLSSVIWLPLVVLFWDKILLNVGAGLVPARGQPQGLSLLAPIILIILLALMFLGGEPTIFYVTAWFLAFYALVFSQHKVKSLAWLAGILFFSLCLMAVQLIPFIELAMFSDRVARSNFSMISFRSFPMREVITFIFPFFFGNQTQYGSYTPTLLGKNMQDWLVSPYMGILPMIFLFFSFRGKEKKPVFFALAGVVSLLLAFGRYTPFYTFLYHFVPGVSLIRYPVKYLFLTTFCLALLSSFGFDRVLRDFAENKKAFKKYVLAFLSLCLLLVVLLSAGYSFAQSIFNFLSGKYPTGIHVYFMEVLIRIIQFNLQSLLNLTGYFFLLLALFWLAWKEKIRKPVFAGAIILIAAADLFSAGPSSILGARAEIFSKTPENYAILKKDKTRFRFFYTPDLEVENGFVFGNNYSNALFNSKDNFAANWHLPYHFFDLWGYESITPMPLNNFYRKYLAAGRYKKNLSLLSLLNVKYIASKDKLPFAGLALLRYKDEDGQKVFLYKNKQVFPRAYFLNGGKVVLKEYKPGKIVLQTSSKKDGRLFLSEAYYPGWSFYIDGKKAQVLKEREVFTAVDLPAGKHKVKYVYEPMSFKLGAVISLISLFVLIGGIYFGVDDRT